MSERGEDLDDGMVLGTFCLFEDIDITKVDEEICRFRSRAGAFGDIRSVPLVQLVFSIPLLSFVNGTDISNPESVVFVDNICILFQLVPERQLLLGAILHFKLFLGIFSFLSVDRPSGGY